MLTDLLRKKKNFSFDRTYPAPIERVWDAWTRAEILQQWWGPPKTTVPECAIDLRPGGRLYVVTMASADMGKYEGTRWPMEATLDEIDAPTRLTYDAASWTEGSEDTTRIEHRNELTLTAEGDGTALHLDVQILAVGPKAKMASFGMKWGYKAQLDGLAELL